MVDAAHHGLHHGGQREAEDQRPQDLPGHRPGDRQGMAQGMQPPHDSSSAAGLRQRRAGSGPGADASGTGAGGGAALPGSCWPRCARPWPELPRCHRRLLLLPSEPSGAHYTRRGYREQRRDGRLSQRPARVLEADDLADRAGPPRPGWPAAGCSGTRVHVQDAVAQVVGEQARRDLLQGPGGRGDLDHYIRAPAAGFDHILQGGAGPAREGDRPTQVRGRGADNRYAAQRVLQGRAGIVWVAVRPGG